MLNQTTTATFKTDIKDGLVLVDFWAEWCGPCRILHPTLEEIDSERDDIRILSVDIDANPELAVQFGVQSIPTMIMLRDGAEIKRIIGAQPKRKILTEIDEEI